MRTMWTTTTSNCRRRHLVVITDDVVIDDDGGWCMNDNNEDDDGNENKSMQVYGEVKETRQNQGNIQSRPQINDAGSSELRNRKPTLTVAYRGGQRGRFAPGGTLRGAAKKGKKKKRKKKGKKGKKEKEKKREKEKYGRSM